jgi:uncharacterized protein (TIGR03435 family)
MFTNRPVLNITGLAGIYAIKLDWTPDESGTDPNGPSLGGALDRELGLKLESRKTPVVHLIIDKVMRTPREN